MIVAKFGGGVLSGPDGLLRVTREIRQLPRPAVLVVSAFVDVTNRLERLATAALQRNGGSAELLRELVALHHGIAAEVLPLPALQRWRARVEPYEARLAEVVRGLEIVGELSDRTLDLVVSFGEQFASALVLESVCGDDASAATPVPAPDIIITEDTHRYARPNLELTGERVAAVLRPAAGDAGLAVTEGYIARTISGEITTMGRESSDYSATLLGQLLGATEVRIYTGVPGVLTADPKVVWEARTIASLGYRAARTLAELGAKVLHPRTVGPVESASIPLVIRPLDGPGTCIGPGSGAGALSVALLPTASIIAMELPSSSEPDEAFIDEVARRSPIVWRSRFHRRLQIVTETSVSLKRLLPVYFGGRAHALVRDAAVVSIVSDSVVSASQMSTFFASLGSIEPLALFGGVERHAVSAVVAPEAATELVRVLHHAFIRQTG